MTGPRTYRLEDIYSEELTSSDLRAAAQAALDTETYRLTIYDDDGLVSPDRVEVLIIGDRAGFAWGAEADWWERGAGADWGKIGDDFDEAIWDYLNNEDAWASRR